MGSQSSTQRGRLNLHLAKRRTARHRPPTEITDEPTLVVGISPSSFDSTLNLGERFVDRGEIARGGMSSIHRVRDRNLLRDVALKVLNPVLSREDEHRLRFIKEAQITGQLEHPNIVPIYEIGVDDTGAHFFAMKLIRGETLGEYLARVQREHPGDALYRALQVFLKVCDALSFAHSRGVIHRDVKPSNIMVGDHGQVYLMDWGIAYLTRRKQSVEQQEPVIAELLDQQPDAPGTVIGTYAYMSPEQAQGRVDELDERSDVFSLGGVLYFVLTGRRPFDGQTDKEILAKAQACELRPPEEFVDPKPPQVLSRISMKALAAEPADRYASVEELKAEVEEVLRGRWRFPVVRFPAGTLILQEGESGNEAFVIRSGRCEVYRRVGDQKHVLGVLGPGDVFGETAVFTGQPRNACVAAVEGVELWVVAGKTMLEELGLDSWMGAFVSTLGRRFSERSNAVTRLQTELAREKLLRDVLKLIARDGRKTRTGERSLPWSHVVGSVGRAAGCSEDDLREIVGSDPGLRFHPGRTERLALAGD